MSKSFSVYTDGASRGNPGEASIGVVVKEKNGALVKTLSESLGLATNNEAEYTALIRGLEVVVPFKPERVDFYLDSQLVVRQMTGVYKIKNKGMVVLAKKAKALCEKIRPGRVYFHHIPREQNKEADRLANQALDSR